MPSPSIRARNKPLEICEFNADGDVGGRRDQAALLTGFYRRVIKEKPKFLKAITYYQFRDRGRLGLEQKTRTTRVSASRRAFSRITSSSW